MLTRKVGRDARAMAGRAVLLLVLLLASAAITHTLLQSATNLRDSYDAMYDANRLEHLDLQLAGPTVLPDPVAPALKARGVPHVADAVGRLTVEGSVRVGGQAYRALLIGFPDTGWPAINDVCLLRGDLAGDDWGCSVAEKDAALGPADPLPGPSSALIHAGFARAHGIAAGERLPFTVNGTAAAFDVSGFALSSEFLVTTADPEYLVPEPGSLAVVWVRASTLQAVLGAPGAVNEVLVRVTGPDVEANARAALRFVRDDPQALDGLGGPVTATVRWDTSSYVLTEGDVSGFDELSPLVALLVSLIAAATVSITARRLVASQRTSIGVLRALGLSRAGVARHYLALPVALGLAGGAVGVAAGVWGAAAMSQWYRGLLGFPVLVLGFDPETAAVAFAVPFLAAVAGGASAARRAAALPIREAMAPEPGSPPGRLAGWATRRLPLAARLAARNLSRRKGRTAFTVLGLSMGLILSLSMAGMTESMSAAIDDQIGAHEHWDASATLDAPRPADTVVPSAEGLAWVDAAEPYLVASASADGMDRPTRVVGLVAPSFHSFSAVDGADHFTGPAAALVTRSFLTDHERALGRGVAPGDALRLSLGDTTLNLTVAGVVDEPLGATVYVPIDTLSQALAPGAGRLASGLYVTTAPGAGPDKADFVEHVPGTIHVATRQEVRAALTTFVDEFQEFTDLFTLLGVALGAAVVLNTVAVNLQEREFEHATLRALGAPRSLLVRALSVEGLLLGLVGAALGVALGLEVAAEFLAEIGPEVSFSLGLDVPVTTTVGFALLGVLVAQLMPAAAARTLGRMDLAGQLKRSAR